MSENLTGNIDNITDKEIQERNFNCNKETYPILKFKNEHSNEVEELNIASAKKNVMIFGSTGTGKTSSVILPCINNLIKNNNCGLIMDIKSELYQDIYTIAKYHKKEEDVVFIGTESFCENINILASVKNAEQLKNVLNACKPYSSGNNEYWWFSGVEDVLDVLIIDEWYKKEILGEEYTYSFKSLYSYITNNNIVYNIYKNFEKEKHLAPENVYQIYQKNIEDSFSLYSTSINKDCQESQQQKGWRSGQLATVIRPFIENPFYEKINNINKSKTIHDYIFKEGKVLVLVVPVEYETIGYRLGKLIREIYFKSVLSNNSEELRTRLKLGDKFNRYSFLLIDEYQGFINTESSAGVITDESWTGISRSFENINIFATQSIASLKAKNNENCVDTIIQNCVNEIILPNKDPKTISHIDLIYSGSFTDSFDMGQIINPKKRLCLIRSENNGVINISKSRLDVSDQVIFHKNEYKNSRIEFSKELNKKEYLIEEDLPKEEVFLKYKNGYGGVVLSTGVNVPMSSYKNIPEIHFYNKELLNLGFDKNFVENWTLTTKNIFLNKNENFKRHIQCVNELKNFVEVDKSDQFVRIFYHLKKINRGTVVKFIGKKSYKTFYDIDRNFPIDNLITIEKKDDIKDFKSDILCVFIGGGDLKLAHYDKFRKLGLFKKIKEKNPNSIIFTALAHAEDVFLIDLVADLSFITPTEMGLFLKNVNNILEKKDILKSSSNQDSEKTDSWLYELLEEYFYKNLDK